MRLEKLHLTVLRGRWMMRDFVHKANNKEYLIFVFHQCLGSDTWTVH